MVHTPGVAEEKVTGLPDAPPVALTVTDPAPSDTSGGCGKEITCGKGSVKVPIAVLQFLCEVVA